MSYYYSKLNNAQRIIYKKIVDAIICRKNSLQVAGTWDINQMRNIWQSVSNDHPEFFYIEFENLMMISYSPFKHEVKINYKYQMKYLDTAINEMNKRVDNVLLNAKNLMISSEIDKCRWIHDILIKNISYNDKAVGNSALYPEAFTIQGVFEQHSAVCEGISKAVTLLGNRLGIELPCINGTACEDPGGYYSPHAWNLIVTDGKFAHLDVTWDMNLSRPIRFTRYDYFGVADSEISCDHKYDDVPLCVEKSGLSFFEKTNRLFDDISQCEQFIENKLKNKSRVFYFKVSDIKKRNNTFCQKIDNTVMKIADKYISSGFSVQMAPNLEMGVFLYRITGSEEYL